MLLSAREHILSAAALVMAGAFVVATEAPAQAEIFVENEQEPLLPYLGRLYRSEAGKRIRWARAPRSAWLRAGTPRQGGHQRARARAGQAAGDGDGELLVIYIAGVLDTRRAQWRRRADRKRLRAAHPELGGSAFPISSEMRLDTSTAARRISPRR